MSWPRDAFAAVRKIVLIEERMEMLSTRVKSLAETCTELDRRLIRIEAKFELLEKMAGPGPRRRLPETTDE